MRTFFISIVTLLSFCFLSIRLVAQITTASQWTWVNGDNSINSFGVYGNKGFASSSNKPGARQGSVTWTDASGNLWLFGGRGNAAGTGFGLLNDLWKYNLASNQWTWVNGDSTINQNGAYGAKGILAISNKPGARTVSVSWTDPAGNFWLFGGNGFPASGSSSELNDLWKYNPANNQWTWINGDSTTSQNGVYGTLGTPSGTNKPGARFGGTNWIDANGNFWLWGGQGIAGSFGNLNDLWKYNPATNQWAWMKGSSARDEKGVYGIQGAPADANTPGSRLGAVGWADASGNLWLFGGSAERNDLWKYTILTNRWTWINGDSIQNQKGTYGTLGVPSATNMPGARMYAANWKDASDKFWLFGGITGAERLNDFWQYNPVSNQWTWIKGDSTTEQTGVYGTLGSANSLNKPGARAISSTWIDAVGNFWLFGGNNPNRFNDLWKLGNTGVLPIKLSSLRAYQQNAIVAVEWKVENETGIKQYEVEKSTNGSMFIKTATRLPIDNSNGLAKYTWTDASPLPGNSFYRIRTIGVDSKIEYSHVVKVVIGNDNSGYVIYPNPSIDGTLQLQFVNKVKGVYQVRLLSSSGQVVQTYRIVHDGGSSTEMIKRRNHLASGNYFLEVIAPDKSVQLMKIYF